MKYFLRLWIQLSAVNLLFFAAYTFVPDNFLLNMLLIIVADSVIILFNWGRTE